MTHCFSLVLLRLPSLDPRSDIYCLSLCTCFHLRRQQGLSVLEYREHVAHYAKLDAEACHLLYMLSSKQLFSSAAMKKSYKKKILFFQNTEKSQNYFPHTALPEKMTIYNYGNKVIGTTWHFEIQLSKNSKVHIIIKEA